MAAQKFTLSCEAFKYGAAVPQMHTCDGDDHPPKLTWMHPPAGTKSFALIVDDPDAPNGTFTHWIQFDIPAAAGELSGADVGVSGRNDFQKDSYGGPCPPANHGEHRYFFKLHALDVESLGLKPGAPREEVQRAMEGHVLDQAETMGRYERKTA